MKGLTVKMKTLGDNGPWSFVNDNVYEDDNITRDSEVDENDRIKLRRAKLRKRLIMHILLSNSRTI